MLISYLGAKMCEALQKLNIPYIGVDIVSILIIFNNLLLF
jgi:hypothetical protein